MEGLEDDRRVSKPRHSRGAAGGWRSWLGRYLIGLLLVLSSSLLGAQPAVGDDAEIGRPFLRVYEPLDYDVGSQILSVAQDGRGLLYFAAGTSYKLLEYDGERWRRLPIGGPVIDLATDDEGRIWVAASQDFGYLEAIGGTARFVSLADRFPEGERPLGRLRRVVAAGEAIWFASRRELVRCVGDEVTVWTTPRDTPFGAITASEGQLFVYRQGLGITAWPPPSEGGESLAPTDIELPEDVFSLLPHPRGGFLAGTVGQILHFDGGSVAEFSPAATQGLAGYPVAHMLRLADGGIAVTSVGAGLLLLDESGGLRRRLDDSHGLPSNTIYKTFEDPQGSLWLVLSEGIVRVSGLPASHFPDKSLRSLLSIGRHGGQLFLGTLSGGFRLRPSTDGAPATFEPIAGLESAVWSWASTPRTAVAAGVQGVWEVDGNGILQVLEEEFFTTHWDAEAQLLVLGGRGAIRFLAPEGTGWRLVRAVDEPPGTVVFLAQGGPRNYWILENGSSSIRRLSFPEGWAGKAELRSFESERPWWSLTELSDGPRFLTEGGIYRFDPQADAGRGGLLRDPQFDTAEWQKILANEAHLEIVTGAEGHLLRVMKDRVETLEPTDSGALVANGPVFGLPTRINYETHVDPADPAVLWLDTLEGPVRLDTKASRSAHSVFPPRLRLVLPDGGIITPRSELAELPYGGGTLRFEYAIPYFLDEAENEYRHRVVGLDAPWSPWTQEPYKELTVLPSGDYRFELEARHFGRALGVASLEFRITPPWYRTPWAWALWVFSAIGAIWLASWIGRLKAARERENLERLVAERTAELKILSGLLPICSTCKKVRDDEGYWSQIETYVSSRSEAEFSHSFCPECARAYAAEFGIDLDNLEERSPSP